MCVRANQIKHQNGLYHIAKFIFSLYQGLSRSMGSDTEDLDECQSEQITSIHPSPFLTYKSQF